MAEWGYAPGVNLRRGMLRLGLCLAALWLVFWTCAYVLRPRVSENGPPPPPALSPSTDLALIAVAVVAVPWVVSGFRDSDGHR